MILQLNNRDSTETEKIALYFTKLHIKHSYWRSKDSEKKENLTVRHVNMFLMVLHKGSQNYKNQIVIHKIKIQIVIV